MKICYHCMSKIESDKKGTCPYCNKKLDAQKQSERFLEPGTLLQGRFVVGHPIGYGGFGNTYIGWNEVLLRKVAIKEYYPEQFCERSSDGIMVTTNTVQLHKRFERGLHNFLEEARNVAALQDIKGVVKISNFFEANGTGYIVMEYLEGMDVKSILKHSDKKKDYEWSRRVVLTVLHTLREVHARGVLHRDISPDNIFVTNDGVIKLIDFGAAKHSADLAIGGREEVILKRGYAPIEQYGNTIPQGPYTDLYGVAALFYRMLTGQKPIPADERISNDGLLAPSDMGISIPEQAEFAIMVCLNLHPEYRLQTADQFMEALGGSRFVPVYEPEWILPKIEDNNTASKKLKGLPLSAKIALGASTVIAAAGLIFAVYVYKDTKDATVAVANNAIIQDLSGKTLDEAESYINNLNKQFDLNLEIVGDTYVYNSSQEQEGVIKGQSVPVGTDLQDIKQLNQISEEDFKTDDAGKISGTIHCSINSSEKVSYVEWKDKNVFEISKMMGEEITSHFFEKKTVEMSDDHPYWSLAEIVCKDGDNINPKKLRDKKNELETIDIANVDCIRYYAYEFNAWDKLPDFAKEYGTLDKLNKATFKTYNFKDENHKQTLADKKLNKKFIDNGYYSLDSAYPTGKIIGQTKQAGKPYDGSKDTGLKIKVVKQYISSDGLTASQVKNRIEDATKGAKKIKINVVNGDEDVVDITVKNEKGEHISCFKDKVVIEITGREPKKEESPPKENKSQDKKQPRKNNKPQSRNNRKPQRNDGNLNNSGDDDGHDLGDL